MTVALSPKFLSVLPEVLLSAIKKAYSKPKTPAISLPDGSVIVGLRKRDRRVEDRTVPIAASQVKKKDGTSGGPYSKRKRPRKVELHGAKGKSVIPVTGELNLLSLQPHEAAFFAVTWIPLVE